MARKTRFLVYMKPSSIHPGVAVCGLLAKGHDEALREARDLFGEGARAESYVRPAGWQDNGYGGDFYTKNSSYGVRYQCRICRTVTLGIAGGDFRARMHRRWCPLHPEAIASRGADDVAISGDEDAS